MLTVHLDWCITIGSTAIDNFNALLQFFNGFSEYSSNDFYITGESYAGIYVPTLAQQVHESNSNINLKGIMVGNGCIGTEVGACAESESARIHSNYLNRMGLFSDKHYETIQNACGDFSPSKRNSEACKEALSEMHLEVGPVNVYNVCTCFCFLCSQQVLQSAPTLFFFYRYWVNALIVEVLALMMTTTMTTQAKC